MLFFQALSIFFQSDVSRQHCRLIPATLVFVSWFIRHFWQLFIGILWASIVSVSWIVNIKPQPLLFQNNKGNGVIVGGESWVSVPSLSECHCQSVALWISCLSEAVPEILTGSLLQPEIHQLKGYHPSSSLDSLMHSTVSMAWVSGVLTLFPRVSNSHVEGRELLWFSLICWPESCSSWVG